MHKHRMLPLHILLLWVKMNSLMQFSYRKSLRIKNKWQFKYVPWYTLIVYHGTSNLWWHFQAGKTWYNIPLFMISFRILFLFIDIKLNFVHTEVIFMLNAINDLACSTRNLVTSISLTLIEIRRVNPVLSHHRHIKLKRNTCAYSTFSIFNAKCNNDLTDSETST